MPLELLASRERDLQLVGQPRHFLAEGVLRLAFECEHGGEFADLPLQLPQRRLPPGECLAEEELRQHERQQHEDQHHQQ